MLETIDAKHSYTYMNENEQLRESVRNLTALFRDITNYYVPANHPDFDVAIEEIEAAENLIKEQIK